MKNNPFRKRKDVNIGIVIFLFIFLYLVVNIVIYFTKTEIPIYEVQPGYLYAPATYSAMILRKEQLYTTDSAGYINFYFREGARIAKEETVYSIDKDRTIYDLLAGDASELKLSSEETVSMKEMIQSEFASFRSFSDTADGKAAILSEYQRRLDETLMQQLNDIVRTTGVTSNFRLVKSETSGIVSYVMDDYTNYTKEEVTEELFMAPDTASSLYTTDLFASGSVVYKMITSDQWSLVVLIDETMYQKLLQKATVSFSVEGLDRQLQMPVTCYQKGNSYFAEIAMNKYMTNYTSKRFVSVTFDVEHTEGLKIPESAIGFKDYYRIPEQYFVSSGNQGADAAGLILEGYDEKTGEKVYTAFQPEVFYSSYGFRYVDASALPEQTYIVTQDLENRAMLYTFLTKLEGAYNINKGYAVFRRIERLNTSGGYCIVKRNSISGLSAYDHIARNANHVTEGEVIY